MTMDTDRRPEERQQYELNIGGGYVTWCFSPSLETAIEYAVERYGNIVPREKIKVTPVE